jgi:DNA-binding NarL/FixJ family response regulator
MVSLDKGLLYKEIAVSFNLTLGTFKQYTHTLYKKLGVSNRTEAINKYFKRK